MLFPRVRRVIGRQEMWIQCVPHVREKNHLVNPQWEDIGPAFHHLVRTEVLGCCFDRALPYSKQCEDILMQPCCELGWGGDAIALPPPLE